VITATVETERGEFSPSEVELRTSRFNEAARLSATYVDDVPPAVGSTVRVLINETLAGRFRVVDAQASGEGTIEVTGRDAIRQLKNATITQDFVDERPVAVAEAIADAGGVRIGVIDVDVRRGISPTFSATPTAKAAQTVARLTDSVVFVNERNRLRVVSSPEPTVHTLDDLKPETTVGTLEQPFTQVQVFGSSAASTGGVGRVSGRQAQILIASNPPSATVGDGDGRTYVTRFAQATTQEQCKRFARKLLREFQRQRAEGEIVALGQADIRPLDVVELPPLDGAPSFLVSGVRHRLSSRDGFVTEITPGRVVDV
jgi:hypothetical protein